MSGHFIFGSEVILIDSNGKSLGQIKTNDALTRASDQGLDLIEVGKQGRIPICKIGDRGKWEYEQKKKKKMNASQHHHIKEFKFGVRIMQHDIDVKINQIKNHLEKGDSIVLLIQMRGREKAHQDIGRQLMESLLSSLDGLITKDDMKISSGQISIMVHPCSRK